MVVSYFGLLKMSLKSFFYILSASLILIINPVEVSAQKAKKGKLVQRFASIRANDVNVRAGPGVRYPVKWKFVQRHAPIEVIAQYDTWRKIRDWEGGEGWVHRAMLEYKRSLILIGVEKTMRRRPSDSAPAIARLSTKMIVLVKRCDLDWCYVSAQDHEGWIRRKGLWGIYPKETIR